MSSAIIHGFKKTQETAVCELDALLCRFTHMKTGLELAWLKRSEENKTFGIAFETLPENDTGVFHILEHSTLCGSEKYPVKEPFVDLMKNSMNTFLNAMTFPDKTVYPASSKNNKDFMNLISVYLDAVFRPMIYKKPEIFHQEGWHYEFDEDGSVCYNGIVLNEMKGVYSDPDEITENALNQALFPDTPYHFSYGGDPAAIPDLSYEDFLETHRRFYSPSNACIFLDGDLDIEAVLKLLDDEYLSKYEKTERLAPPAIQQAVSGEFRTAYEVASAEEEAGAARLIFGNVIGDFSDREKIIGMEILSEVLCGNNQAPLCKAILESGIAEDAAMSVQSEILQPYVKLELKNIHDEDIEKAEVLIRTELQKTVLNGIDRESLKAAIANAQFKAIERDNDEYPQGIMLCFQVLENWLYGGNPAANLEFEKLFENLKTSVSHNYFENLIQGILLDNPHKCKVVLIPSHTLGEERGQAEAERLTSELNAFSEKDIQKLYDEQTQLVRWQTSEDAPETAALMPKLTLSDIDTKPEEIPSEFTEDNGIRIIKHPIGRSGICYCSLYFDADGFNERELSELSLLCELLGKLNTETYSAGELTNAIRSTFGSLEFSIENFAGENEILSCKTKFCVSFSALTENMDAALKLALHILQKTVLTDTTAIIDIIRQRRIESYQEIVMSGSLSALRRLSAGSTVSGAADECCGGIAYYQYLQTLDEIKDFTFLRTLTKDVLCRNKLTASFTGDIPEINLDVFDALPEGKERKISSVLKPWGAFHEGIIIPADISYAAAGGNIVLQGGHFTGRMALMSHIISLDYLWNVIRVQGGAYGTGLHVRESGFFGCYSYRDPSAADSLETFSKAGEFLKEKIKTDPDLTGAIIGTIADSSPLLSVRMKGQRADALYFKNITYDNLCERRRNLLNSSCDDLLPLAELLSAALQQNNSTCVIGSEEQIEACGCTDRIITL